VYSQFQEANRKLFGTPLHEVLQFHSNRSENIPYIVEATIKELENRGVYVEGIGRLSGAAATVDELRQAFDRGRST
jgi:hypothetical protein